MRCIAVQSERTGNRTSLVSTPVIVTIVFCCYTGLCGMVSFRSFGMEVSYPAALLQSVKPLGKNFGYQKTGQSAEQNAEQNVEKRKALQQSIVCNRGI
jgi:hypothetical protein